MDKKKPEDYIKDMGALEKDINLLADQGSLSRTLEDVDRILEQLIATRESIVAGRYSSTCSTID